MRKVIYNIITVKNKNKPNTKGNGDVVELAEYEDYNTCEEIFQSIAVWASLEDDTSVFILWHEDLVDEIKKQKEKYGRNYYI